MDQLPATRDATTSLVLSAPLASALNCTDERAAALIAADAVLLAEAREMLPVARAAAARPAMRDEIKNTLIARFVLYPQPQRDTWEWDLWWADYFTTLDGLSAESIDAGMALWIAKATSEFLPKPGALRELAAQAATPSGRTYGVLLRAVELGGAAPRVNAQHVPLPEMRHVSKPREDRLAVRQMADEWNAAARQRQAAKPRPEGQFHLSQGVPAEGHHVTQAMLDLMR